MQATERHDHDDGPCDHDHGGNDIDKHDDHESIVIDDPREHINPADEHLHRAVLKHIVDDVGPNHYRAVHVDDHRRQHVNYLDPADVDDNVVIACNKLIAAVHNDGYNDPDYSASVRAVFDAAAAVLNDDDAPASHRADDDGELWRLLLRTLDNNPAWNTDYATNLAALRGSVLTRYG